MKPAALLLLIAGMGMAHAQTAYRWVDQNGKVHFSDRPPPPGATRELQEKRLAAPAADKTASFTLRDAASKHPVTLYVGANCGAPCQEGRDFLGKRGIPFAEKTLSTAEEIDELRGRVGNGELSVPVLQVGTRYSKGFLGAAWGGLLDAAGYPKAP